MLKKLSISKFFFSFLSFLILLVLGACGGGSPAENPFEGMDKYTVDDTGGEITDDSGLVLTVPSEALVQETEIYIKSLDASELAPLFESGSSSGSPDDFLFAFRGEAVWNEGNDEGFNQTVTASFPVPGLTNGDFVAVKMFDSETNSFLPSITTYIVDYENKTVELELDHFSSYLAEVQQEMDEAKTECATPETACMCKMVKIEYEHINYSCSSSGSSCSFRSEISSSEFIDCSPVKKQTSEVKEISSGCTPSMELTADETVVESGDTVSLEALFMLSCAPFAGENISYTITGPGSLQKTTEVSDASGKALNSVIADDLGTIVVTARGTGQYYEYEQIINGQVLNRDRPHSVDESDLVTITVINKPEMVLSAGKNSINPGQSTQVIAVITRNNQPLEGEVVNFIASGSGSLNASSAVTNSSGIASVTLTAGDSEGTVTITADSLVETVTDSGESVFTELLKQTDVWVADESLWTGNLSIHYDPVVFDYYMLSTDDYYEDPDGLPSFRTYYNLTDEDAWAYIEDVITWEGGDIDIDFSFNPEEIIDISNEYLEGYTAIYGTGKARFSGFDLSCNGSSFENETSRTVQGYTFNYDTVIDNIMTEIETPHELDVAVSLYSTDGSSYYLSVYAFDETTYQPVDLISFGISLDFLVNITGPYYERDYSGSVSCSGVSQEIGIPVNYIYFDSRFQITDGLVFEKEIDFSDLGLFSFIKLHSDNENAFWFEMDSFIPSDEYIMMEEGSCYSTSSLVPGNSGSFNYSLTFSSPD